MKPWEEYIHAVQSGERLAGRREKLAIELFLRRCKDERYYFDEEEAEWALKVIGTFRHTKGDFKGTPFSLFPWQKFVTAWIYGLKRKDTSLRVTRKVLIVISKKGGKSEYAGALAVVESFYMGEQGAECYSVANARDQAKYCFNSARIIVEQLQHPLDEWDVDPELEDVTIYNSHVNMELRSSEGSSFKAVAANSEKQDGFFPQFGVVDEYHAATDTDLPDNIESGMVSRAQPLLAIITTRGFNIGGPLWELERNYDAILSNDVENDDVLPLIFEMDQGDDWEDEKNWEKSNPAIGISPSWEGLRSEFRKAKTEGATREISFKTKNLNLWEKTNRTWLRREDYNRVATDFDVNELEGMTCYGGLDLATVRDLTALTYWFPPCDRFDQFRVFCRFYIPEETARKRATEDAVPYLDWAANGHLTLTPGNVTDYSVIEADILSDMQRFDVRQINYDRYNSSDLVSRLVAEDAPMNPFAQTTTYFNDPIRFLEKTVLGGELDHGLHPVLAWNVANVQIYTDTSGNVKFNKGKSQGQGTSGGKKRIDGAVALAMSVAAYLSRSEEADLSNAIMFFE